MVIKLDYKKNLIRICRANLYNEINFKEQYKSWNPGEVVKNDQKCDDLIENGQKRSELKLIKSTNFWSFFN